mmetsp:Transcript_13159/g.24264  ORF Transcript_13159/g.24264 Transcript_13159/m.24264 type:complete len:766 (-) Transcript_13159:7-2304(-)
MAWLASESDLVNERSALVAELFGKPAPTREADVLLVKRHSVAEVNERPTYRPNPLLTGTGSRPGSRSRPSSVVRDARCGSRGPRRSMPELSPGRDNPLLGSSSRSSSRRSQSRRQGSLPPRAGQDTNPGLYLGHLVAHAHLPAIPPTPPSGSLHVQSGAPSELIRSSREADVPRKSPTPVTGGLLEEMFGIVADEEEHTSPQEWAKHHASSPIETVSASDRSTTIGTDRLREICLEYSFDQLRQATDNFAAERRLGSGGSGTVYKGEMPDGLEVAIKLLHLKAEDSLVGFEDEVATLSKFRHPNLVVLMGWAQDGLQRAVVYEHLPGGDLLHRLRKCKVQGADFTWTQRLLAARDVAMGLAHLHSAHPKAFHRDVKSANILLMENDRAKLGDFGLSCVAPAKSGMSAGLQCQSASGTVGYACPSYIRSGLATESSEVYSFGIVLFELLLNLPAAEMVNGELTYPLLNKVLPAKHGAQQRVLDALDPTASWPKKVAAQVAQTALACVGDGDRGSDSVTFIQVCRELRNLSQEPDFIEAEARRREGWSIRSRQSPSTVRIAAASLPPPFGLLCIAVKGRSKGEVAAMPRAFRSIAAACAPSASLRLGQAIQAESFWMRLLPPEVGSSRTLAAQHCEVTLGRRGLLLKQTSNSASTFINGVRLDASRKEVPLQGGDVVGVAGNLAEMEPMVEFEVELHPPDVSDAVTGALRTHSDHSIGASSSSLSLVLRSPRGVHQKQPTNFADALGGLCALSWCRQLPLECATQAK